MTGKIDPYKHEQRYLNWKQGKINDKCDIIGQIEGIAAKNSDLLLQYISDMERGINVSVSKGARSCIRLNTLREKLTNFTKHFEKLYPNMLFLTMNSEQLLHFFNEFRSGKIKTKQGRPYRDTDTVARIFTAFWHWLMKVKKKEGVILEDITSDLDKKNDSKPEWVYLDEGQVKALCNNAKYEYKILMWFLYDTGIRSPTEL